MVFYLDYFYHQMVQVLHLNHINLLLSIHCTSLIVLYINQVSIILNLSLIESLHQSDGSNYFNHSFLFKILK